MGDTMEKQPKITSDPLPMVFERWGDLTQSGFTAVPNTLIKAQVKLGLSPNDVLVLLNLIMHWWKPSDLPFPRTTTIAERCGLKVRTVQRALQKMERQGYIKRVTVDGKTFVDLVGLKEKLKEIESRYTWAYEATQRLQNRDGGQTDSNLSDQLVGS